jgi:hypothetical protein
MIAQHEGGGWVELFFEAPSPFRDDTKLYT